LPGCRNVVPCVPPVVNPDAAQLAPGRRALFLDRDGVINVDLGYVHRADDTQWVAGIFELCRTAADCGFVVVVVTNQAGIGRGLYNEAQFKSYTEWMLEQFHGQQLEIQRVYYCPHHPDHGVGTYRTACCCRKPAPGMMEAAARDLALDLAGSIMIGDKVSDMRAAGRCGIGTRLLYADAVEAARLEPAESDVIAVSSLEEARHLVGDLR